MEKDFMKMWNNMTPLERIHAEYFGLDAVVLAFVRSWLENEKKS